MVVPEAATAEGDESAGSWMFVPTTVHLSTCLAKAARLNPIDALHYE